MTHEEILENIQDGCKVTFLPEYNDPEGVFTVSQYDEAREHGWAGDEHGRGWFFYAHQIGEIIEDA